MRNIIPRLLCVYTFSAACQNGIYLNVVDLNKDSAIAALYAVVD